MNEHPTRSRDENREHRNALADALQKRSKDIEERWVQRVGADVRRDDVSETELRDAMPDYLRHLTEALRGANSVELGGHTAWTQVAQEHALTRVRLGFDVEVLVHEFIVLQQVLFDVVEEEGVSVDYRQAARVAELIQGAIAAAVKSYVDSRDYEARKKEARHIGFVTHELRNPLTTVTLVVSQLMTTAPRGQTRPFELIARNLDRIVTLIDSVLLMERLEAGEQAPELRDIALGTALQSTLESAEVASQVKGLALDVHMDPDTAVRVDPSLTACAVGNVLENAIKYTDHGFVSLEVEVGPNEVTLHVRDNCSGISEEELATIFEPFRRGHTGKKGTGLGLTIARRAIEAQRGAIHAESTEERGCHFWMTLPRAPH